MKPHRHKNTTESQLWIVSEYFHPEVNATGSIITSIAQILSKENLVNVITTSQAKPGQDIESERLRITRIRDSWLNKNNLYQRLIRIVLLSFRLFVAILRNVRRNDIIITVTNPTMLTLLLRIGKILRGFKIILIVHDVFPENLVATGIVKHTNPFYNIIRRVFNRSLRNLDAILVIGRDMEQLVKAKINRSDNIFYLPNFADTESIKPSGKKTNPILEQYGLADKLVVLFAGNIGRAQNIGFICQVLLRMKDHRDVHFLFIGEGALKSYLASFLSDHNLENATLLPSMEREHENDFLNAGDIGLVMLSTGFKGLGVPSKTYSYMAAGKPILCVVDEDSEIGLLVNEHEIGWCVGPGNVEQFVTLIMQLNGDYTEIASKGALARSVCEKHFTPEIYTARLTTIINQLNDGNAR